MITVEVIAHTPDVAPFRDAWEELYRSCAAEPSTSFEWTHALTRSHLGRDDGFVLLRVSRGGSLVGLIPLTTRSVPVMGYPVVVLSPVSEHYNTHSDLLVRDLDEESLSAVVSALPALDVRWDIFRMSTLLDGHPVLDHARRAFQRAGFVPQLRNGHASYFLSLPETFEHYLAQRSAKFRNHLKRIEKKIESAFSSNLDEVTAAAGVSEAFDALLQVERRSWKHAHGTAISAVPRQSIFYKHLCDGAAATGRLHLQFLSVDGAPVAYNLGYISSNRYAYLKTSYDERYKPYGVATYLRARLVEAMILRGVTQIDFPAEPYEWERQWTDTARWHSALTMYRPTAAGRVLSWIDRARRHGRDGRPRDVAHVNPRAIGTPLQSTVGRQAKEVGRP